MCGIVGFWLNGRIQDPAATLWSMARRIQYRGPDAGDIWFDTHSGVGLGHRRLAIVELSSAGAQPMRSPSGRYTIVFNGEIYNFERIRRELSPLGGFVGRSDTEVMLHAFEAWGIEASLQRFIGMFAFAAWDAERHRLVMARDRLGKKPLYYGFSGSSLLFASELKAFREFPGWSAEIDRTALTEFLRYGQVPGSRSIFKGVFKLSPGTSLEVNHGTGGPILGCAQKYWSIESASARSIETPFAGSFEDAQEELAVLLGDATKIRTIADVPLGAFLSGGVDSSLVVAMMQQHSKRPVRTFSIGFDDASMNEAHHAKEIAKHLGTDHTELYVDNRATLDVVSRLPEMFDEPFADSSQVPTYLVCAMARQHVTVALSGDGGDEAFCGYVRYLMLPRIWRILERYPKSMISIGASLFRYLPEASIDRAFKAFSPFLPKWVPVEGAGERMQRLAELALARSPSAIYQQLLSHWSRPTEVVIGGGESPRTKSETIDALDPDVMLRQAALVDTAGYLPNDILVKVDRASMATSLEVRSPLLDHRVLEFAWTLPNRFLVEGERGKRILWSLLYRHVPRELVDRPKQGFGVPLGEWLRGPLRDWAEALLEPSRLHREGYFHPEKVQRYWRQHISGTHQRHYLLWDVLMFQAWLERQEQWVIRDRLSFGQVGN